MGEATERSPASFSTLKLLSSSISASAGETPPSSKGNASSSDSSSASVSTLTPSRALFLSLSPYSSVTISSSPNTELRRELTSLATSSSARAIFASGSVSVADMAAGDSSATTGISCGRSLSSGVAITSLTAAEGGASPAIATLNSLNLDTSAKRSFFCSGADKVLPETFSNTS